MANFCWQRINIVIPLLCLRLILKAGSWKRPTIRSKWARQSAFVFSHHLETHTTLVRLLLPEATFRVGVISCRSLPVYDFMTHANIDLALSLVAQHFKGMTDKDGEPYVMHCLRVMMGVEDPQAQLVGLMHDLVEDTPVTIEDLRNHGFAPEVVDAVDLVTHPDHLSYSDYVIRLKPNPLARDVKLSDLRDNCGMSRVLYREDRIDGDAARIQRYVLTYQFLTDRIDEAAYKRLMQPHEA